MNGEPITNMLSAIERATGFKPVRESKGWKARCPAHDDTNPSLSVCVGDDGKTLLHCHAGCNVESIAHAVGMKVSDLFQPRTKTKSGVTCKKRKYGCIVAVYDYHDANGQLIYQVLRDEFKQFSQRRPGIDGRWIWNMRGVKRVLFNLPELLQADPALTVFVAEGEKDCLTLAGLALTATCNSGGSGMWHRVANTSALHGRPVVIIGDKDETGRKHARQVADAIHGEAASVRILELPGDGVKDVTDWIESGGTKDELHALAEAAPLYESSNEDDETPFTSRVVGRRMDEVEGTEIRWLWTDRIPRGRLTVIAGDGGLGKSFLTMSIAARVSTGIEWPDGAENSEPADVVLLNAEDDPSDTLRERLEKADANCRRIHLVEGVQNRENADIEFFSLVHDLAVLESKIETIKAKLCIVDPIVAYMDGTDSHRDAAVRSILGPLAAIASRTDCAIVAVMHTSKSATTKASHRVNGSVAFTNAARMAWLVGIDPDDDTRRLFLPFKSNIIQDPTGLAFRLVDGSVHWLAGEVTTTADEILAEEHEDKAGRSKAVEWLEALLVRGAIPVKEIEAGAKADCVGWRSVERAKKKLGVVSERGGFGRSGSYSWRMPEVAANDAIDRQPKSGGQCGIEPRTGISPIDRQPQEVAVYGRSEVKSDRHRDGEHVSDTLFDSNGTASGANPLGAFQQ